MKKLATLLCILVATIGANAQIFWTENFESGSTGGVQVTSYTGGPNGPWTQTITGTEGNYPNPWYVSCAENGHTSGVCGTGCVAVSTTATLATLHVGADPSYGGDAGASYDAGGLCSSLGICITTDRRAESPTINCTGKYTITMRFYYIMDGQAGVDYATVWYYDGTTWALLASPAQTAPICPGGQGLWTAYSVALPTSANNNPNVKIGFRWVNNDDGVGTDPSFAVDSVNLSTPVGTSSVAAAFTTTDSVACQDSCITFTNTSTGTVSSYTWSSSSGFTTTTATATPVTICYSVAGVYTVSLTAVGTGTTNTITHTVTINPAPATITGTHTVCVGDMIGLTETTAGGTWSSSNGHATVSGSTVTGVSAGVDTIAYTLSTGCKADFIVTVTPLPCTTGIPMNGTICTAAPREVKVYPNPAKDMITLQVDPSVYQSYIVMNEMGQIILKEQLNGPQTAIDIKALPPGLYCITARGTGGSGVTKFVKN